MAKCYTEKKDKQLFAVCSLCSARHAFRYVDDVFEWLTLHYQENHPDYESHSEEIPLPEDQSLPLFDNDRKDGRIPLP
jgi:hypothetical protein